MDISSIMGTILGSESIEGVAKKTGASKKDVTSVLTSALPQLLSGANKQSTDSDTAEGFANALNEHAADDTSSISGFLSKVDLSDGAKIVGHLLGGNSTSNNDSNSNNILSAAAPLLMSLLGKQTQSSSNNQTSGSNVGGLIGGLIGKTDIAGLATSLIGGGSAKKTTTAKKTASAKTGTGKTTPKVTPKNTTGKTSAKATAAKPAKQSSTATAKKGTPAGATATSKKKQSMQAKKQDSAGLAAAMGKLLK